MSKISQQKQSVATDFPNIRPSLDLRFALAKKLDPRVTFTRGTSATYVGADGYLKIAVPNEPRFNHDPISGKCLGLLIEESRTNLLSYSNQFENWTYKDNISLISNSAISPDGTLNAYKQVEDTAKYLHRNTQYINLTSTAKTYTFSIFIKQTDNATIKNFEFGFFGGDGFVDTYVDISLFLKTGYIYPPSVTGSYSTVAYGAIPYPNDWYRFYVTATTSAFTGISPFYGNWTQSEGNTYRGDGTSGFYVYGAQFELGSFPTSYIPTDSTAGGLPRSSDTVSMSGTNFSNWYNQSEGTIYAAASPSTNNAYTGWIFLIGTDFNNGISYYRQVDYQPVVRIRSNLIDQYNQVGGGVGYGPVWNSTDELKMAFSVKTQDFYSTLSKGNSQGYNRDTQGTLPSFTGPLYLGGLNDGTQTLNGCINRFTYYPIKLTDKQLYNLTL